MNKYLMGIAVFILGLLLCCKNVSACEALPKEGFPKFVDSIYSNSEHEGLPSYAITEEDAKLLMQIGVLEGGENDVQGIAEVMQVILNRCFLSDEFPSSISEVIFQRNPTQFCTADKLEQANITEEAYAALDAVIWGEYQDNECVFFESCPGLAFNDWADYEFSYGGHDFYK